MLCDDVFARHSRRVFSAVSRTCVPEPVGAWQRDQRRLERLVVAARDALRLLDLPAELAGGLGAAVQRIPDVGATARERGKPPKPLHEGIDCVFLSEYFAPPKRGVIAPVAEIRGTLLERVHHASALGGAPQDSPQSLRGILESSLDPALKGFA